MLQDGKKEAMEGGDVCCAGMLGQRGLLVVEIALV